MAEDRVAMAKIVAAHGIRGRVKILCYTEHPDNLMDYGALQTKDGRKVTVSLTSTLNNVAIASINNITDRNEAEKWIGTELYILRSALPPAEEGEYSHHDLIGLRVENPDHSVIGTIKAIYNFGAGDLLEIATNQGTELIAFTKASVPEVNLAQGKMIVIFPEVMEGEKRTGKKDPS